MDLKADLTVKNFVNGTVTKIEGSKTLTVKGTLTPGTRAIPKLTLASGATVKATGTAQIVSTTFAASGTITIDASEITREQLRNAENGRIAVLTVPASFDTNSAAWAVSGEPISGTHVKWVDNGNDIKTLYLVRSAGLTVIFR